MNTNKMTKAQLVAALTTMESQIAELEQENLNAEIDANETTVYNVYAPCETHEVLSRPLVKAAVRISNWWN